ncbi:MAG: protein-tyrosine phosphatase family protein [Granulosicoccus sp.]
MRPDIYKVSEFGSGYLAIMAKPITGEWIDDEFSGIAREGIRQIVSLLEPHEEYAVGLKEESVFSRKHGMGFISYPIQDRGLPESVSSYRDVTKRLYNDILDGSNTVVHCRAGIGRAGMVVVGVLLHSGMDPESAFDLVSEKRGVEVPDTEEQKQWVITNYNAIAKNT